METIKIAHISGLEVRVAFWHKRGRDFKTPHNSKLYYSDTWMTLSYVV